MRGTDIDHEYEFSKEHDYNGRLPLDLTRRSRNHERVVHPSQIVSLSNTLIGQSHNSVIKPRPHMKVYLYRNANHTRFRSGVSDRLSATRSSLYDLFRIKVTFNWGKSQNTYIFLRELRVTPGVITYKGLLHCHPLVPRYTLRFVVEVPYIECLDKR